MSLLLWLREGQRKGGGVGLPRLAVARIAKTDKRADEGGLAIWKLPQRGSRGKVVTLFISQGPDKQVQLTKPTAPSPFLFTLLRLFFQPSIVCLTPDYILASSLVHQFVARKTDTNLYSFILNKGCAFVHTSINRTQSIINCTK